MDVYNRKKKESEYRSLNAANAKLSFLKSLTDISLPDQEGPDFVFIDNAGSKIGIEHFYIDISMGSRKNSGVKMTEGEIKKIFNKNHKDIQSHFEEARQEIEEILNRTMREWQNFDYQTFCNNFKVKFNKHFLKIEEYKNRWNLSNIGFLIEFLVPGSEYVVSIESGHPYIQELRDFPITTSIQQILEDALNKLDFIILDTNQHSKNKDSIMLINKENKPQHIFKEFAPLFKGEKGKVILRLTD